MIIPDSLFKEYIHGLDSATAQAQKLYNALKYEHDSLVHERNSLTSKLQNKADSLISINLPPNHLLQEIDSINALKETNLSVLKNKCEALKSNTISRIDKLDLPPELKSKVEEYTNAIRKLDLSIPTANLQLPSLDFTNGLDLPIQDLKSPLTGSFPNPSTPNMRVGDEVSKTTSQLEGLNQSMPKDIETIDQLGNTAETQLSSIDEISAVRDQMDKLPSAPLNSEEQVKQVLLKQAKEVTVNHFAGNQQELKSAMDEVSKLKKRFPSINNLQEITKKRPNEMKGKPLIKRIVPGISFQIQKRDDALFVDFNPYAGYRFTGKLTAGAGWNQRVSYKLNDNTFQNEARIFGPRVFGEYKLLKGFSPRVEVEAMNTFVPSYIKTSPADLGGREWVWGAFIGMKKDYKFLKKINGTALVMVRLFDPERKSPYADVVNARFGFEFPMKKKK